jgi:putative tryptophan/tyrosine transport system substrate-binding protein
MSDMRRREFITLLGGAAAWPLGVRAQTMRQRPLVGLLQVQSLTGSARYTSEFLRGMAELGHVEGRDIDLERRYAAGELNRLPVLANELVKLKPDVIVTSTSAAALALVQVTQSIPIVATAMVDPVGFGLAASEARPGGQVTGILISLDTLPGKQLALALEVVPGAAKVGVLLNALNPTTAIYRAGIEAAAASFAIKLVPVEVRRGDDLDAAFQAFVHEQVELVFVAQDSLLLSERARLATLATAAHLPTMYGLREHVEVGGLICYGINVAENFRRAATFVEKILKGAKAGNMPIEWPVRLELLVNLKTAKSIGLVISESFLVRADEVIE